MAGKLSIVAELDIGGDLLYFYFFPFTQLLAVSFSVPTGLDRIADGEQIESTSIKMECDEVRAGLNKPAPLKEW